MKPANQLYLMKNVYNSRQSLNNGSVEVNPISPLNLLHNYTVRYNKDTNTMDYIDYYDFNALEDFVPGTPYTIKGSIKLK